MDTRRIFIDTLYDIIPRTKATTFSELIASWKTNIKTVFEGIRTSDPEIRKLIYKTNGALIKVSTHEMKAFLFKPRTIGKKKKENAFGRR